MEKEEKLIKINNKIKSYINEANYISIKHRNKLIKMIAEEFKVDLPIENFANIDITILENGNIIMRDDEYKTSEKINNFKEVEERFKNFEIRAESFINKKNVNAYNKKEMNNVLNIFIILGIIVISIFLLKLFINSFFSGNYINCLWLIMFISSWLIPSFRIKERFEQAKRYIKRKFKK